MTGLQAVFAMAPQLELARRSAASFARAPPNARRIFRSHKFMALGISELRFNPLGNGGGGCKLRLQEMRCKKNANKCICIPPPLSKRCM